MLIPLLLLNFLYQSIKEEMKMTLWHMYLQSVLLVPVGLVGPEVLEDPVYLAVLEVLVVLEFLVVLVALVVLVIQHRLRC
jgi:hypothetical protein